MDCGAAFGVRLERGVRVESGRQGDVDFRVHVGGQESCFHVEGCELEVMFGTQREEKSHALDEGDRGEGLKSIPACIL